MEIKIKKDFKLSIATASSRLAKKWKNREVNWSDLLRKCSETRRTPETTGEYSRMTKDEQSAIKDVGGFVGGYLREGTRKKANVASRSMATLDIDYGRGGVWDDFTMDFDDVTAMLYSTHKHTKEKPRYRLVIPFSREVSPQEYEPICRRIAAKLDIELFDVSTYETARLFYWPSTSKNGDYVFRYQDGKPLDVDEILQSYVDYRDASSWPTASREGDAIKHEIKKAGDPTEKPGVIGAFCRAHTIEDIIEGPLSDIYEPTATPGRYTYRQGTVAGGLVCYDGKFAYSHHETDPAGRQLCNAFDLARIHLFGTRDEDSRATDVTKLPSYSAMMEYAAADGETRALMGRERMQTAREDFDGIVVAEYDGSDMDKQREEVWKMLDCDKKGPKSTTGNMVTAIENDPGLKGKLWHDLFSGFDIVEGGLPWDKDAKVWGSRDDANLRVYLDKYYGIVGKDKIKDAKDAVLTKHKRHPIREYLSALRWDGTPRLDRLIIDYIGAEDCPLTRAMTRKHFTAAVARVYEPGCKYDYCLILTGQEGIGKSTLFSVMGGEWFSDSLLTMEGKTAMEQLRCAWIVELSELASVKRSEVEQVKSFISRRDDIYRAAYASTTDHNPRQCVFTGTTNEGLFLKGETGNRRFWVIGVDAALRKYPDWLDMLRADRDQLWAEAVVRYREHEPLYLSPEMEREARERQKTHNDDRDDPIRDMLRQFLDMKLPAEWDSWELNRRRSYLRDPSPNDSEAAEGCRATKSRTRFCIPEFICERLGIDMAHPEYKYLARRVRAYMSEMEMWEKTGKQSRYVEGLYGVQRFYCRKAVEDDDEDL